MTRSPPCLVFVATVALGASASCGDNARVCGAGTDDIDGVCAPSSTTACGDGTKLEQGLCVIDPAACQEGTALVAGKCVDPTRDLVVDLEESFEPNGLGVASGVEASAAPAGTIALKRIGEGFVVHGHFTPFRDADGDGQLDPDADGYVMTVGAPSLLEITVDGVGGAQGAFYLVGDPTGVVPAYERYGLNLTGDTTRRQLFLPAPGTYTLVFIDTRALAIGSNPPPPAGSEGAAGGPIAEYYATLTPRAIPAPTVIPAGATASLSGTLAADQVALFTATFAATNRVRADMPGAATASLAVIDADLLVGYADERTTPPQRAELEITSVPAGHTPLIVVDTVYNYGPAAEPFTVTVEEP